MTTFGPENNENRSDKVKSIALINKLVKNTDSGTLNWQIVHNDKDVKVFLTTFALTPSKKLAFSLRTSTVSKEKNDNVLKMMFKINIRLDGEKDISVTNRNQVIRTLYLAEFPSLVALAKKLNKLYLGLEFTSPYPPRDKYGSAVIEVESVEEYKDVLMKQMRLKMREIDPTSRDWESDFAPVTQLYLKAKNSFNFDELNNIFYDMTKLIDNYKKRGY